MAVHTYKDSKGVGYRLIRQTVRLDDGTDYARYYFTRGAVEDKGNHVLEFIQKAQLRLLAPILPLRDVEILPEIPEGYTVVEREHVPPLLVSSVHTDAPPRCQRELIQRLAEACDYEYYMGCLAHDQGRAERAEARVLEGIDRFESLSKEVTCPACRRELAWQMQLQKTSPGAIDLHLHSPSVRRAARDTWDSLRRTLKKPSTFGK